MKKSPKQAFNICFILGVMLLISCNNKDSTRHSSIEKVADTIEVYNFVDSIHYALFNINSSKKYLITRREIIRFDSIKNEEISLYKEMLKKSNEKLLTLESKKTDSSKITYWKKKVGYAKDCLKKLEGFSGYLVTIDFLIPDTTMAWYSYWITDELKVMDYSYVYPYTPVYEGDSLLFYVDEHKYINRFLLVDKKFFPENVKNFFDIFE